MRMPYGGDGPGIEPMPERWFQRHETCTEDFHVMPEIEVPRDWSERLTCQCGRMSMIVHRSRTGL